MKSKHLLQLACVSSLIIISSVTQAQNKSPTDVTQSCIPANQLVTMDKATVGADDNGDTSLGAYERISPDGRFVLRSYSSAKLGDVSLIELPAPQANAIILPQVRAYTTPLRNESFPVQGTWRYLVDTYGAHYRFIDILQQQTAAKPLFRGGMTGFYAAAAELPGSSPQRIKIRSLSWPNASSSDENQGVGALSTRTLEIDTLTQKIVHDSGANFICTSRAFEDGTMYALPMISVDGTEFAALPQNPPTQINGQANKNRTPTMRIYGFGASGQDCEPHTLFNFSSGKVIFGFPPPETAAPQPGATADLAYKYNSQIWWYNRTLGQTFPLDLQTLLNATTETAAPAIAPTAAASTQNNLLTAGDNPSQPSAIQASAFPGITRDGRIIYAVAWSSCDGKQKCSRQTGYVITDPYQNLSYRSYLQSHPDRASPKACITLQEVAKERNAFAAFHGIP